MGSSFRLIDGVRVVLRHEVWLVSEARTLELTRAFLQISSHVGLALERSCLQNVCDLAR